LRYALSYLEKARTEKAYAGLICDAEAHVARIRDELRKEIEGHAGRLQEALREQEELSALVTSGTISPKKANARSRRLTAQIEELREDIGDLNTILAVKNSEELGGFADLPIGAYPRVASPPPPGIQWKPTRKGFVIWLVCLVLALVGVLVYKGMLPLGAPMSIEILQTDVADDSVGVVCRNKRLRPFSLCVPWPAEGLKNQGNATSISMYGLAVYVRGEGEKKYQEVFVGPDCWSHMGRPLMETWRQSVGPYSSVSLAIMLNKLEELDVKPAAIRFAIKRPSGRIVATCETELER